MNVLLVEDSLPDATLVRELLHRHPADIQLEEVDTVVACNHALAETAYDAILLDLSLPDGHGLDVLELVLQVAESTPIVILTGNDDEHLARAAVRLGAQDYLTKSKLESEYLVKSLTWAIERRAFLTERLLLSSKVAEASKFEALGRLSAHVAHEIKNPLQYISFNIEFVNGVFETLMSRIEPACDHPDAAALEELPLEQLDVDGLVGRTKLAIKDCIDGIRLAQATVDMLHRLSHPSASQMQDVDLNAAIESAAALTRSRWRPVAALELELDPELPPMRLNESQVVQALSNLIVNAADAIAKSHEAATEPTGRIRIATSQVGPEVVTIVEDNAEGMDAVTLERIFEPFFTTKSVGYGTGQGLGVVRASIVDVHGGHIECRSTPGTGTVFELRFHIETGSANA